MKQLRGLLVVFWLLGPRQVFLVFAWKGLWSPLWHLSPLANLGKLGQLFLFPIEEEFWWRLTSWESLDQSNNRSAAVYANVRSWILCSYSLVLAHDFKPLKKQNKLCLFPTYHVYLALTPQTISHSPECCKCASVHAVSIEPKFQHYRGRTMNKVISFERPTCLLCNAIPGCWHPEPPPQLHIFNICMVANVTLASSVTILVALKYCSISKIF